jgi:hypothetical protein
MCFPISAQEPTKNRFEGAAAKEKLLLAFKNALAARSVGLITNAKGE